MVWTRRDHFEEDGWMRLGHPGVRPIGLGMLLTMVLLGSLFSSVARGATYYLAPTGSDANAGTAPTAPWKTFRFALPRLQPGDTLLLQNGTYTGSNSGYPRIACGTNAANGTATHPITVKAANERKAWIRGDGTAYAFEIAGCAYWTFQGLRISGADNDGGAFGDPMWVHGHAKHLIFRRLLVTHNNRYMNSHLLTIDSSNNVLVEESEFYYFHRHAIVIYRSDAVTLRRNYVNSRGYADIPGGYPSGYPAEGDGSFVVYPGTNSIIENNISEGSGAGYDIEAHGPTYNNRFYGNIALNNHHGALFKARGNDLSLMPQNTYVENYVAVRSKYVGLYVRGNKNTRCHNCSFIGNGLSGFSADVESGALGDGAPTVYLENALSVDNVSYGLYARNRSDLVLGHMNSYGNGTNFHPAAIDSRSTGKSMVDPQLGTCKVFIPVSSPMKGAGKDGADIGANVRYRYKNGILTSEPLWDSATGRFPCGAIVAGVNNIAGSSCFDVHKRLNVNVNGCSLPSSNEQRTLPSSAK